MAADQGTGSTISFGGGFTADILSISASGAARDVIETSHMGTTTAKTFVGADIQDNGEVSAEIAFLGNQAIPALLTGDAEAVSINWAGAGNTWAFSGIVTGFDAGAEINERMTASITIKVSGDITLG